MLSMFILNIVVVAILAFVFNYYDYQDTMK